MFLWYFSSWKSRHVVLLIQTSKTIHVICLCAKWYWVLQKMVILEEVLHTTNIQKTVFKFYFHLNKLIQEYSISYFEFKSVRGIFWAGIKDCWDILEWWKLTSHWGSHRNLFIVLHWFFIHKKELTQEISKPLHQITAYICYCVKQRSSFHFLGYLNQ